MECYRIENLTFSYPNCTEKALDDVSFSVEKGEFVTVFGESGSGKSTLLRLLKTAISPYGEKSGRILYDNREISELCDLEQSRKIGFVLQNPDNGIVCDKVWHELCFGLEGLSVPSDEIRSRTAEMASYFGLDDIFGADTATLSGGQKQLLNLASVMVSQPEIIILDEPTSQLDPIAARNFVDSLSRVNRELGTTVIVSEHRLENLLGASDRVLVLEKGKKLWCGIPSEVGKKLKEANSPLALSLPVPMRIHNAVENDFPCPVDVREGRAWLEKMTKVTKVKAFPCPDDDEKKGIADVALKLDGVFFRYEKNADDVVKNLSMTVYKCEKYVILGGNGTGKTTTLSLISGIKKPNHGTIKTFGNRVSLLPQDPSVLFVCKNVYDELCEGFPDKGVTPDEKAKQIDDLVKLCGLESLLSRHPFDLSGGEAQRLGLAKILASKPDVLLLDEPTKGLDCHFKNRLSAILDSLCKEGVTVIIVSHDIEFCAEFADRSAMFFGGSIVSEDVTRRFFSGKSFYTTSANRMSRGIIPDAVLADDVILALGGKSENKDVSTDLPTSFCPSPRKKADKKPKRKVNVALGLIFLVAFAVLALFATFGDKNANSIALNLCLYASLGLSLNFLVPQKRLGTEFSCRRHGKMSALKVTLSLATLCVMALTVCLGNMLLEDRKYYFISLLLILEAFLPFILCFEGAKPKAREIVTLSVMCALAVCGRGAFFSLPQFKPVAALVIISGVCFGAESGFVVGAMTGFVSNFFFGQGPWTPWQMFAFGIIGFFAGLIFDSLGACKQRGTLCIYGFLSTLFLYGGLLNLSYILTSNHTLTVGAYLSSVALGLPFDLVHAFSTVFFLWFLAPTMIEKLDRLKTKYGLLD